MKKQLLDFYYKLEKIAGVLLFALLIGMVMNMEGKEDAIVDEVPAKVCELEEAELNYNLAKADLVTEVDIYIKSIAPNSKVNADVLVNECVEHGFDLKLALVQAHKESHFGTKGVASKTNSIFNVAACDGLTANQIIARKNGYDHPDQSIQPYILYVQSKYLVNGKEEKDLLRRYVTRYGARYASDPNYEVDLKRMYYNVDSIANISQTYLSFLECKERLDLLMM